MLIAPPLITIPAEKGDTVSLFPLGPVTGRSEGLEWPIAGIEFDPLTKIGTSNRAIGPVTLEMSAPNAVLILPARLIQPVVQALAHSGAAGWPPRAK